MSAGERAAAGFAAAADDDAASSWSSSSSSRDDRDITTTNNDSVNNEDLSDEEWNAVVRDEFRAKHLPRFGAVWRGLVLAAKGAAEASGGSGGSGKASTSPNTASEEGSGEDGPPVQEEEEEEKTVVVDDDCVSPSSSSCTNNSRCSARDDTERTTPNVSPEEDEHSLQGTPMRNGEEGGGGKKVEDEFVAEGSGEADDFGYNDDNNDDDDAMGPPEPLPSSSARDDGAAYSYDYDRGADGDGNAGGDSLQEGDDETRPQQPEETDVDEVDGGEHGDSDAGSSDGDSETDDDEDSSSSRSSGGSTVMNFNHISFDPSPVGSDRNTATSNPVPGSTEAAADDDTARRHQEQPQKHRPVFSFDRMSNGCGDADAPVDDAVGTESAFRHSRTGIGVSSSDLSPLSSPEGEAVGDFQQRSDLDSSAHASSASPTVGSIQTARGEGWLSPASTPDTISSVGLRRRPKQRSPGGATQQPRRNNKTAAIDLTETTDDEAEGITNSPSPPPRRPAAPQRSMAHHVDLLDTSSDEDDPLQTCRSPRMMALPKTSANMFASDSSAEGGERNEASSEENSWNGDEAEDDEDASLVDELVEKTRRIVIQDDDGESNEDGDDGVELPRRAAPATEGRVKQSGSSPTFRRNRESITEETVKCFNSAAFSGRLSGVSVTWSNKLRTTAGLTRLLRKASGGREAKIELSTKIIDDRKRLRATLLHEMCHAAAWLVDNNSKPPHGPCFKKWAKIAMSAVPDVEVTTTHDYAINSYKYAWACENNCPGVIVQRHSNSFKFHKYSCKRCEGRFVEIEVPSRKGQGSEPLKPRKKAPPSAYNIFVKDNLPKVRRQLSENNGGNVSQKDVMSEVARQWQAKKANT